MIIPFKYGKVIEPDFFVNREKEIADLQRNFTSKINTTLISPRRWGKSSLVKYAALKLSRSNKNIVPVFIDIFNVRNEETFYEMLSLAIIKATSTKREERFRMIKAVFRQLKPKITFEVDHINEFKLGFDLSELKKNPDEILNLPENISKLKKINLVICIDEFQNIGHFENALAFQKKLRAHWQHHNSCCYCLYGSKRNMLTEIFNNKSMPFYKFGDLMFLTKINRPHWITYIQKQFKKTKKNISPEASGLIADLMQNHPYYVQQLAAACWENTTKNCTNQTVYHSLDEMLVTNDLIFQRESDLLSNKQINFIKALANGVEKFSTAEIIRTYDLGSSANVVRVRKALVDKEVIDIYGSTMEFIDPLYRQWIIRVYMK